MKTFFRVYESDGYNETTVCVFADKAAAEKAAQTLGHDGACAECDCFENFEEFLFSQAEEKRRYDYECRKSRVIRALQTSRRERRARKEKLARQAAEKLAAIEAAKQLLKANNITL